MLQVGDLESRELGPVSRVWSEPGMVEAAAYEFAETVKFLEAGRQLDLHWEGKVMWHGREPSMVEAAAYEFAETAKFLEAGWGVALLFGCQAKAIWHGRIQAGSNVWWWRSYCNSSCFKSLATTDLL